MYIPQGLPLVALLSDHVVFLLRGYHFIAYCTILDGSLDELGRFGVHSNVARAVDHAVELDGLGELRERLGRRSCEDCLRLGGHFDGWRR